MTPKAALLAALAAACSRGPSAAAAAVAAFAPVGGKVTRGGICLPPPAPIESAFFLGRRRRHHLPPISLGTGRLARRMSDKTDDDDGGNRDIRLDEYARRIQENVLGGGDVGKRGEGYVALQFGLLFFIALGGIPFVGEVIFGIIGTALILGGLAVTYLAAAQLGTALSPWPVPVEGGDSNAGLSTDGVYGMVRHPIYAGLIAGMAGLSMVTDSAVRLLLTVVLTAVLNMKAEYEEGKLAEAYGAEYAEYLEKVEGRFLPQDWVRDAMGTVQKIVE